MAEREAFLNRLTAALVPKYYLDEDMIDDGPVQIVYRGRDWVISRYLLSVSTVASLTDLRGFALEVREDVRRRYRARWFFREIGLQTVIVLTNQTHPINKAKLADSFGNHAVIIQGVHVVDLVNSELIFDQSNWFGLPFSRAKTYQALAAGCLEATCD